MSLCDSYILAVAGGLQPWDPLSASCWSSASQKQLLYVGTQTSVLMGLFMECSVILILSRAVNHGNSPLLVKNARVPPRVRPIITCCWRPVGGVCWVNLLTLDTLDTGITDFHVKLRFKQELYISYTGNYSSNSFIHQKNLICVIKLIRGLTRETGRQHLDYCEILDTTWSVLMINKLQPSVWMLASCMTGSFICIYSATPWWMILKWSETHLHDMCDVRWETPVTRGLMTHWPMTFKLITIKRLTWCWETEDFNFRHFHFHQTEAWDIRMRCQKNVSRVIMGELKMGIFDAHNRLQMNCSKFWYSCFLIKSRGRVLPPAKWMLSHIRVLIKYLL